ncbi:MAG TPA: hypothetical protein PLV68_06460, partial [Ilumatobacteraceae bacterium]|nr:hypothetical protein [Ilumatobacteraceae bacterium]
MTYLADRHITGFDAILFDAGGILMIPDPSVLMPLLVPYGASDDVEAYVRAHYRGMAAKSAAGAGEKFWHEYNVEYCTAVG